MNDATAPLAPPAPRPRFHSGLALGTHEGDRLMASRYAHLVGIIGSPDAGKTAALVSLYLLLSRAKLPALSFADSDSLMAFHGLARGARKWNSGTMPDQMTGHTELGDERTAGFLHLRVKERATQRTHDLLLPDLPGEWTTQLVDKSNCARLAFLRRADTFWIVLNGKRLADSGTRNQTLHRAGLMLERVNQFLRDPDALVCFVVTHRDSYTELPGVVTERLIGEAQRAKVPVEIFPIASFSTNGAVVAGEGLSDLVLRTLACREGRRREHPALVGAERQILRHRTHHVR